MAPAAKPNRLIEWPSVRVEELAFRAILVLHGRTSMPRFAQGVARVLGRPPPDASNTFVETRFGAEGVVIAWAGPEEWFVIGQEEGTSGLRVSLRQAIPEADGAVVDVSSGFTLFSLEGRRARDLIAAGCSIDVHPRVFEPGRCAQTLYARIGGHAVAARRNAPLRDDGAPQLRGLALALAGDLGRADGGRIGRMGETELGSPRSDGTLDAKGLDCPLPILKTKVALSRMKAGEVLHVAATDPHSVIDFKAFCARTPHELVHHEAHGDLFEFWVRNAAPRESPESSGDRGPCGSPRRSASVIGQGGSRRGNNEL